jgi:hypothetical protein
MHKVYFIFLCTYGKHSLIVFILQGLSVMCICHDMTASVIFNRGSMKRKAN